MVQSSSEVLMQRCWCRGAGAVMLVQRGGAEMQAEVVLVSQGGGEVVALWDDNC